MTTAIAFIANSLRGIATIATIDRVLTDSDAAGSAMMNREPRETDVETGNRILADIRQIREWFPAVYPFSHDYGPAFDREIWHRANDDPNHTKIVEIGITAHEYLWVYVGEWLRPLEGFDEWSSGLQTVICQTYCDWYTEDGDAWIKTPEPDALLTALQRELEQWIQAEYGTPTERQDAIDDAASVSGIPGEVYGIRFGIGSSATGNRLGRGLGECPDGLKPDDVARVRKAIRAIPNGRFANHTKFLSYLRSPRGGGKGMRKGTLSDILNYLKERGEYDGETRSKRVKL